MIMKKVYLFALVLCLGVFVMYGCTTTTSSDTADPPAGTTTIEVGSGGAATGEAGSTAGTIYTVVLNQDNTPLTNLLSGNVTITIWVTGETTSECSVVTISNNDGATGDPITYVMTLDRSGSMLTDDIASLETAALAFIDNTGSSDQGAIINFDDTIAVDQALTTDKGLLSWAVTHESTSGGSTALYSSMYIGVDTAEAGANTRKAVLAMTDGNNNKYVHTSTEVIAHASALGIPIYTIGLGTNIASSELRGIATGTGGFYYNAPTAADLNALYESISSALTSYYTVSFTLPSGWTFTSGSTYYITFQVENYGTLTGEFTFQLTI